MNRSLAMLMVVSGLALSTALTLANRHVAPNPRLEAGRSSDRGGRPDGHSLHAVHGPAARAVSASLAARGWKEALSAADRSPVSRTAREAGPSLEPSIFHRIRIDQVAPNTYVVSAMDALLALSNAEDAGRTLTPTVQPMLSFNTGPKYRVDSLAVEGILTAHGFTVTAPKIVGRAGIELGDTLRTVNGRAIDRDVSLRALLEELRLNSFQSVIRLELERDGVKLTKTYRLE